MTAISAAVAHAGTDAKEYRRRIFAWTMYDWANSAFITTVLGAMLPVYYSRVAGATLPSEATATAYWSLGLSLSLLVIAILSPILGTVSDAMRAKKRLLTFFIAQGVLATALLALVERGDWLLASATFIIARIGFGSANVFYDALLPHVAREEDRDSVSARGYAMGFLGGGLLLTVNVAMYLLLPGTLGTRLAFLSVAVWWAVFSIPILTRVPEPPASGLALPPGQNVLTAAVRHLVERLRHVRDYRELFKYLIAFLIYNDGIGTIIGVGVIYGAELGLGTTELVLALLLNQFASMPFALIFGRLPNRAETRRPYFLAFIVFNLVMLPLVGLLGVNLLPAAITGASLPPYAATETAAGEGIYPAGETALRTEGAWEQRDAAIRGILRSESIPYLWGSESGSEIDLSFNGQTAEIIHSTGPDHGVWAVEIDGIPAAHPTTGEPLLLDAYSPVLRYGQVLTVSTDQPGEHTLSLISTGEHNPASQGTRLGIAQIEVLPPARHSRLPVILGAVLGLQVVGGLFAFLFGLRLFARLASTLDTQRSILLSLMVFIVLAAWGFLLDSVWEFWFLAFMISVVIGGSQALSRSLYASMSPSSKSGEFFGLFSVMEKFSSMIGPLMFAASVAIFNSSRPGILSLVILFVVGAFLLSRVNVPEGQRVAREEDAALEAAGR